MSLTPRKTTTKALRRLTRALSEAGAPSTPITIPARVLLRILDKLQNARFQATNEANRASQTYLAWEELRQELARRTQEAQDNAPTLGGDPDEEERIRANERARVLAWTQDGDPLTDTGQATVTELRSALRAWTSNRPGPSQVLTRYWQLRSRYSAEHDAAHHERADFRMAALALLLRPDMKVAITSNNGREKVNALFSAQALWEGQNLGPFPTLLQGPARNDALAAALLMCSLDRDTAPAQEEGPQS